MTKKQWKIPSEAPESFRQKFSEFSPVVLQLLYNRGMRTQENVDEFLNPDYEQDLHDPFLLSDMDKAVDRILQAIRKQEKILVHGDYDADGVTSAVMLYEVFKGLKADVEVFLPSRQEGGYGMNEPAIREFAKKKVQLIVTTDCGITNVKEVALAKKLSMDVIVTDHHSVPAEIPQANAVINPSQPNDKYPFNQLAGVGVAFKLVQALKTKLPAGMKLPRSEKWYLDLVAVGTVADCSPIIGENRTLVKYGLLVLEKTKRSGFKALMDQARVNPQAIDTHDIGFRIGPRLNAAGRLKHSQTAFDLLAAENQDEAVELALHLDQINRERQVLTDKFMREAETQIGEVTDDKRILIAHSSNWPSGVVGLVAGKLCERHSRPVVVLEKKQTHSVGSARSTAKFNIIEAIRTCDELLEKYGGHSQAAGCTVANDKLPNFTKRLQFLAKDKLSAQDLRDELEVDQRLSPGEINWDLHDSLEILRPHGFANEHPRFVSTNMRVTSVRAVGNQGKHLKMDLQSPERDGQILPAIAFGFGDLIDKINFRDKIDVAYEINANEWNGNRELQLQILDIKKHGES
ncbi:single-stranded-DNA-specific exonuclease RecJ [Patescibacteria group bacterium]